jgi:hypothetical protein
MGITAGIIEDAIIITVALMEGGVGHKDYRIEGIITERINKGDRKWDFVSKVILASND